METELQKQEIPKGDWNNSNKVAYFLKQTYFGVITKNQALGKITEALEYNLKVKTGPYILANGETINYLTVFEDDN